LRGVARYEAKQSIGLGWGLLFLLFFGIANAQEKLTKEEKARREKNIQAGNPFAKYGCKAIVATLSKGKYLEVHDLDSIVTIGKIRWHVDRHEIFDEIKIDSTDIDRQPTGNATGMWMSPDPLSEEFPNWSPYNFCMSNPINLIDPDGRAPNDWYETTNRDGAKTYKWFDGSGEQSGYKRIGTSATVNSYKMVK
jgi:hypothetical protein